MLSPEAAAKMTEIMEAETDDLVELMKIAGLNPQTCWRYADMSDADAGEADVAGWDFSGTRLARADLSRVKNIDKAIFNADTEFEGCRLPPGVTPASLVQSN